VQAQTASCSTPRPRPRHWLVRWHRRVVAALPV